MKLGIAGMVAGATLAYCGLAIGIAASGCKATGLTEEQAATVRSYEGEQLLCVDRAKTKEESYNCRCEVKARYGRPCPVPAKDGGQ